MNSLVLSASIHGAILLGAAVAAVEIGETEFRNPGDGFACSVAEPEWKTNRIERPPDVFERPGVPKDSSGGFSTDQDEAEARGAGPAVLVLYAEEGTIWCATCLHEIWEEYGGRVRIVTIPKPVALAREISRYLSWKLSSSNNRTGTPRFKLPPKRPVVHRLGLEVVCTCAARSPHIPADR